MSILDILLITAFMAGLGILRFGLPMLIMWAARQIGQRTLYRHV